jgi:hypothetical protein
MIPRAVLFLLAALPFSASGVEGVCAPASMLKVVTAMDLPGVPKNHFVRAPKTLYRYGERYGRVEEARNSETGLHLLVVVAEPDIWIANLANGRGNYQKDPGPTFFFRAVIFGNPNIQSTFINSLEFGCEIAWLSTVGAKKSRFIHQDLGPVERLEYREGSEILTIFLRSGAPVRLELHRDGEFQAAVQYLHYSADLPLEPTLFKRPVGIAFAGEEQK